MHRHPAHERGILVQRPAHPTIVTPTASADRTTGLCLPLTKVILTVLTQHLVYTMIVTVSKSVQASASA
jgi:hypothetical protein